MKIWGFTANFARENCWCILVYFERKYGVILLVYFRHGDLAALNNRYKQTRQRGFQAGVTDIKKSLTWEAQRVSVKIISFWASHFFFLEPGRVLKSLGFLCLARPIPTNPNFSLLPTTWPTWHTSCWGGIPGIHFQTHFLSTPTFTQKKYRAIHLVKTIEKPFTLLYHSLFLNERVAYFTAPRGNDPTWAIKFGVVDRPG